MRCLIGTWVIYAAAFIFRTAIPVGGQYWFALFDDGMISMRYARNLHDDLGLVWNPGERVEGITNPGWTFIMAALHGIVPLRVTPLLVQILGAVIHVATAIILYRFSRFDLQQPARIGLASAGLTLFCYPLLNWTLQGMEVGLLAMLVLISVILAWRAIVQYAKPPIAALTILGAAMLVRLDAIVPLLAVTLWALATLPQMWKKTAATATTVLLVFLGGQTLARFWYYGEFLPNTYYLKMTGFPVIWRITRGLTFSLDFLLRTFAPIALFMGIVWGIRRNERKKYEQTNDDLERDLTGSIFSIIRHPMFLAGFVSFAVWSYSCYVGGDAWEQITGANRFVSVCAPLYILASVTLLNRSIVSVKNFTYFDIKLSKKQIALFSIGCAVLFFSQNIFRNSSGLKSFLLIKRPVGVLDNERNILLARELERTTPPSAVIAIDYAGTAPYFTDRRFIDLLGKMEPHTARTPMHRGIMPVPVWREFFPGHLKWDYAYTIGKLKPDVVCSIWGRSKDNADDFLKNHYTQSDFNGISVYRKNGQ